MHIRLRSSIPKARHGVGQQLIPPRVRGSISGPGRCRLVQKVLREASRALLSIICGMMGSIILVQHCHIRQWFLVYRRRPQAVPLEVWEMHTSMGIVWAGLHLRLTGLVTRGLKLALVLSKQGSWFFVKNLPTWFFAVYSLVFSVQTTWKFQTGWVKNLSVF